MVFLMVLFALGLKSFQQKVMVANRYSMMGGIAGLIYMGEVSAVVIVAQNDMTHIAAGVIAAMLAVPGGVFIYNRFFCKERRTNEKTTL